MTYLEIYERALWDLEHNNITLGEFEERVKPLNQEPKRWIPVSERLPEESLNSVIGWDAYRERCVFVQYIGGYFQITGSDESFDIVAWMPVPEPYEAKSDPWEKWLYPNRKENKNDDT